MPYDAIGLPLYMGFEARYVRDRLVAGTVVGFNPLPSPHDGEVGEPQDGVVIRHSDGTERTHHPRMLVLVRDW